MLNMNKDDVINTIAEKNKISKVKAGKIVDTALEGIILTLAEAKDETPNDKGIRAKLLMVGFGTFNLHDIPERVHRNPRTQEPSPKPAHNEPRWKPGKMFNDLVNSTEEE